MKLPKMVARSSDFHINKANHSDILKKFPKGIFFAFSAVFFLLPLIVLFQSNEPFGIAAIVAYIACLSLTILLFSAPFFAAYFINYYQKLHQIEEAILLLSDKSKDLAPKVDRTLPSFSAVSYMEVEETKQERNENESEIESLEGQTDPSEFSAIATERASNIDDEALDVDEVKKPAQKAAAKKKKNPDLSSQDKFQLSLFDDAPIATPDTESEVESDVIETEAEAPLAQTSIQVYYLMNDDSSRLFIRGDSPFSWDKGVELESPDVGKFVTSSFEISEPIQVAFLLNDKKKQMSEKFTIDPSISNECYPEIE